MRIAIVRSPEVPEDCGTALAAAALAAAGHRVRLVTDRPDDAVPAPDAPDAPGGLQVDPIDPADPFTGLAERWAGAPPEIVHAVGATAARAALRTGLPVVVSLPPGGPVPSATDAAAAACADRVLAASEDEHTALLRAGVPRTVLRTVPAAVDTDVHGPGGPTLRRGERPRIVTVGPLATGAGAGTAIRALARVPSAELLVGGGSAAADDPQRARLFAAAGEAGVAERVRFLGPVGDATLPRLLRSADVVVAAPGHDVPTGTVLRAMACARPVVASAVGGLRDVVVDRVTGLHVRPGRPDDVAVAVRELLGDAALSTGLGIAGRDRAVSRFERARVADALARVYGEVLGVPAGPGVGGSVPDGSVPDDRTAEQDEEPDDREPVGAVG